MTNPFSLPDMHKLDLADTVCVRGMVLVDAGPSTQRVQIARDDHVPNMALRLVKAYIWQDSEDGVQQNAAIACRVTSGALIAAARFDASDYNQIAWVTSTPSGTQIGSKFHEDIIDPTNLVAGVLYADFWEQANEAAKVNYMFIFQRVELTNTQALISTLSDYIS